MELTKQELLAENAELKRRLEEAEETLEALRSGAVDALVVYAPEGERIFTLQGADQTYRHLVETINEGAATLTAAGDILYANGRLAKILDLPLEQVIGSALREHVAEADQVFFDALFALAKKGESKGEVLLRTGGAAQPAYLSFSSLDLEEAPGALSLVVTDLTQQKRQEALVADGKLSQEILVQAEQPIAVCDASGRIIRASRGLRQLCGQNPLLLPFHLAFPLKLPSNETFLLARLFQGTVLNNLEVNFRRLVDGRQFHLLLNTGPLLAEDQEVKGFVIAFTDITERREAEAEKQALIEKLQNSEEELQLLNEKLQAVNEELQTQMEELQVQGEELRVQGEELRVHSEELRVANQEILAAHQALQESHEQQRRISQAGRIGLYEWNTTQDRAYWCPQAYELFGLEPGSPVNYERWLECVHPQDRERVTQNLAELLERGRRGEKIDSFQEEYRLLHADGTVLWLEATVSLGFDESDLIIRGAMRDITERKQSEEAFKAAHNEAIREKNRLEAVMAALPVGVAILDERGGNVQVNDMYEAIWGGPRPVVQEISDYQAYKAWWEDTGKQVQPEEWASAQAVQQEKTVVGQLLEIERFDGERRYIINSGAPIRDADRTIIGCAVALFDITAQRRAEAALRESDERLRQAAAAGRMFAFEWNPETDAVSRGFEAGAILGLSDDAAVHDTGQGFFARIFPEDRDTFVAMLHNLKPESDRYTANYRVVQADNGQVVWLEEIGQAVFDAEGNFQRLFGMAMDITERKLAEEALKASEERLRLAQEAGRSGTFDWDLRSNTIAVADNLVALAGLQSFEAADPYEAWMAMMLPEDRETTQAAVQRALETGDYQSEFRLRRQDTGEIRWMEGRGQVFFDDSGKPARMVGINMDITERKVMEEALKVSEERLRLAQEAGKSGTFDWDLGNNTMILADNLLALYGIQPGEIYKDPYERWLACIVPEDREATKTAVQRALETGDYRAEFRIHRQDTGEIRWLEGRGQVFFDDSGKPARIMGTAMDITERKLAEEALRRSEERYRLLHETLRDAFVQVTMDGSIIDCNDVFCRMLGYGPEEIRCLTYQQLTPPRWHTFEADLVRDQITARGYSEVYEKEYQRQDGTIVPVELRTVLTRDAAGQPNGMWAIVRDITERKLAEEALRRAYDDLEKRVQERTAVLRFTVTQLQEEVTERLRAEAELSRQNELVHDLYNNAPCGYHSLDAEGWLVQINDTELDWLGYSREEVMGRMHFEDLLTAESQAIFAQTFPVFKERGWVRDLEFELIRKNGSVFPVLLSATAIRDEAGNYLMSRSTVYDITERRRAEEALRESQERLRFLAGQLLTAQEKERKRLAAELHDELGHALLTLKMSLGSIARKLLPEQENIQELLQDQMEYINHVIEEVRRLYHDLSPGDLEDLGLTRALEYLIEEFGKTQPDISWEVELPDLAGRFTVVVQTIIYRLVQEALTNIGKHAKPTQVRIVAQAVDGQVRLVIEDDGQGFDMSEVDQDPNRGVGLAAMGERLYIVGGSLEIWSQVGQGTRLAFTVPTLAEG